MQLKVILLWVFALAALCPSTALSQSADSRFKEGLTAFQKGDFKKAHVSFLESVSLDGSSPVALFNLGLTEHRLGRPGRALGAWRKALALDPTFAPAQRAVRWGTEKLERPEIPHEVEAWESFRKVALTPIPLEYYLLGAAILLFVSGWLLLGYFGARRRSRLDEKPMPGFPVMTAALGLGFVGLVLMSLGKVYDMTVTRGTIVEKTVEVRSAPDAAGTTLFELYEGLEVVVRQVSGEWAQVTYPGASTGWIPRTSLFATTDKVAP